MQAASSPVLMAHFSLFDMLTEELRNIPQFEMFTLKFKPSRTYIYTSLLINLHTCRRKHLPTGCEVALDEYQNKFFFGPEVQ
jgi:hypothetical protein